MTPPDPTPADIADALDRAREGDACAAEWLEEGDPDEPEADPWPDEGNSEDDE